MDFSDYPLPLIFIVSLIAIFAAAEIGRRWACLQLGGSRKIFQQ
jgi:hypothetical protein